VVVVLNLMIQIRVGVGRHGEAAGRVWRLRGGFPGDPETVRVRVREHWRVW
jgi:hypothetical protein